MNTESVSKGAFWVISGSVVAKVLGILVQLSLGWFLTKEEYGYFGTAYAIVVFVLGVRNGGIDFYLIQTKEKFRSIESSAISFSVFFNVIGSIILLLYLFLVGMASQPSPVSVTIFVLTLYLIFGSLEPISKAKISKELQYKNIAVASTLSIISKHLITLLMAILGFGVLSFTLPLIFQTIIYVALVWLLSGYFPYLTKPEFKSLFNIFASTKWTMFSNILIQIGTNILTIVLTLYLSSSLLGLYMFSYMLLNSVVSTVNSVTIGVIFPKMASTSSDGEEKKILSFMLYIIINVSILCIIATFCFTETILVSLWGDKWVDSVVYFYTLVFGVVIICVNELFSMFLNSRGLWKSRTLFVFAILIFDIISLLLFLDIFDVLKGLWLYFLSKYFFLVVVLMLMRFIYRVCDLKWVYYVMGFPFVMILALIGIFEDQIYLMMLVFFLVFNFVERKYLIKLIRKVF